MKDLALVVKNLLETHDKDDDVYRVASDWIRLRHDLSRQWRNKTVEETGLVCERCIMQADEAIKNE